MASGADPILLILAGPSSSGKSTLCDRLVAAGEGFSRVVTSTTRNPRQGELNGTHYHFFTPDQFSAHLTAGDFLEWAWVHGNHRYGTLASSVHEPLAAAQDLVLSIDVQGVASFRKAAEADPLMKRAMHTVFIVVDHDRLLSRMRKRGQDAEADITRRMGTAVAELREAPKFDYLIESRTRDEDFAALMDIVTRIRRKMGRSDG